MSGGNFAVDIVGNKYNRLTVIAKDQTIDARARWKCRCECGNEVVVRGIDLRNDTSKSCGCLRRDSAKKARPRPITINGETMILNRWLERLYCHYSTMQRRAKRNNTTIEEEVIKEYNSRNWD